LKGSGSRPAGLRYCVEFSKQGPARFLAHLDLQSAFERALRRARLPLAFSEGFHPHPRLVFEDALPLGWSSERERLWVDLRAVYPSAEIAARLGRVLPPGLCLQRVFPWQGRPAPARTRRYRVESPALGEDFLLRLRDRFPPRPKGPPAVEAAAEEGGFQICLRGDPRTPPLSLKKVLGAVFPQELPASLRVWRLADNREDES